MIRLSYAVNENMRLLNKDWIKLRDKLSNDCGFTMILISHDIPCSFHINSHSYINYPM